MPPVNDQDAILSVAAAARQQQAALLKAVVDARLTSSVLGTVRASLRQQEALLKAATDMRISDSLMSTARAAMERQELALSTLRTGLLSGPLLAAFKAAKAQQDELLRVFRESSFGASAARAVGREVQLERQLLRDLRVAGFEPMVGVGIGGIAADLTVPLSTGGSIGIEVKAPTSITRTQIARWADQVSAYQESTGGEFLMAVSGLQRSEPSRGIFSHSDVVSEVARRSRTGSRAKALIKSSRSTPGTQKDEHPPTIFAAMPFSKEFDDVFTYAIAPAAKAVGAVSRRMDKYEFENEIIDEIKKEIRKAKLVIADLSRGKPNVFFELGYAHGRGISAIHITSDSPKDLPFDVAGWPTHKYIRGSIDTLAPWLEERCIQLFAGAPGTGAESRRGR